MLTSYFPLSVFESKNESPNLGVIVVQRMLLYLIPREYYFVVAHHRGIHLVYTHHTHRYTIIHLVLHDQHDITCSLVIVNNFVIGLT